MGSENEKEEILKKLTSGEERVFTSTNALGEGIDAPGIRVVIHIGMVDSLDDYGQQSGRAGRDGSTASEAVILRKMEVGKDGRRRPEKGWKMGAEMEEFLRGDRCRRAIMDRYMDGGEQGSGERRVCQRHEQFCDMPWKREEAGPSWLGRLFAKHRQKAAPGERRSRKAREGGGR